MIDRKSLLNDLKKYINEKFSAVKINGRVFLPIILSLSPLVFSNKNFLNIVLLYMKEKV